MGHGPWVIRYRLNERNQREQNIHFIHSLEQHPFNLFIYRQHERIYNTIYLLMFEVIVDSFSNYTIRHLKNIYGTSVDFDIGIKYVFINSITLLTRPTFVCSDVSLYDSMMNKYSTYKKYRLPTVHRRAIRTKFARRTYHAIRTYRIASNRFMHRDETIYTHNLCTKMIITKSEKKDRNNGITNHRRRLL